MEKRFRKDLESKLEAEFSDGFLAILIFFSFIFSILSILLFSSGQWLGGIMLISTGIAAWTIVFIQKARYTSKNMQVVQHAKELIKRGFAQVREHKDVAVLIRVMDSVDDSLGALGVNFIERYMGPVYDNISQINRILNAGNEEEISRVELLIQSATESAREGLGRLVDQKSLFQDEINLYEAYLSISKPQTEYQSA